jgi:hypothetical protein
MFSLQPPRHISTLPFWLWRDAPNGHLTARRLTATWIYDSRSPSPRQPRQQTGLRLLGLPVRAASEPPRAFNPAAMACTLRAPAAGSSATMGGYDRFHRIDELGTAGGRWVVLFSRPA